MLLLLLLLLCQRIARSLVLPREPVQPGADYRSMEHDHQQSSSFNSGAVSPGSLAGQPRRGNLRCEIELRYNTCLGEFSLFCRSGKTRVRMHAFLFVLTAHQVCELKLDRSYWLVEMSGWCAKYHKTLGLRTSEGKFRCGNRPWKHISLGMYCKRYT